MTTMNPHAANPVLGSLSRGLAAVSGFFTAFLAALEEAQRLRAEANARYGLIDE